MARSTAEIQADIAVTRHHIERELDALQQRLPRAWWTPLAAAAVALTAGIVLAQVPVFRLIRAGAQAVQAGLTVAATVGALDRFLAERRRAQL